VLPRTVERRADGAASGVVRRRVRRNVQGRIGVGGVDGAASGSGRERAMDSAAAAVAGTSRRRGGLEGAERTTA